MTTEMISILSPMYTEDERWVANAIKMEIQRGKQQYATYLPYSDGLEMELFEFLSSSEGAADSSEAKRAILLSSALNFYNIIRSAACVLVCDGRTPDEGSVFWAAVAFASGKPVVLYKSDYRIFMSTGDNSMVTGLCLDYVPVKDIKKLNDRVASHINKYSEHPWKGEHIPGYNKLLQSLGEKVWTSYKGRSLRDILTALKNDPLVESLIPDEGKEYEKLDIQRKVYCSGPLFCPAEIREITKIAKSLEGAGLDTYLPHRDGTEAMMEDLDVDFLRGQAIAGHTADINSFTIDVYQLFECPLFVINLNGRVPDDGAVAEAGMAFAMGRPSVLYRSDSRAFFSSGHGFVHPALQMAGHLFDPIDNYDEIPGKLINKAGFLKDRFGYSLEIHHEVKAVYDLGKKYNKDLNDIYTGNVEMWHGNRFYLWRAAHTIGGPVDLTPKGQQHAMIGQYWREFHPYATWMQEGIFPISPICLADLTGNRYADVVSFTNDGVWVALNRGKGSFQTPKRVVKDFGENTGWSAEKHLCLLADLTGNHCADIVGFADNGLEVAFNNGNGTFQNVREFKWEWGFGYNDGWRVTRNPRLLADLTGNHCADIIGFGDDDVHVALNKGDGTFQALKTALKGCFCINQGWSVEMHPRLLADLTGNHCADIVGFAGNTVWTALNNGDGTFQAPKPVVFNVFCWEAGWRVETHPRFLVDLTGNHCADIIGFGENGIWTALNNGDGTFQAPRLVENLPWKPEMVSMIHPQIFMVDLTGNGCADVVISTDLEVMVAFNNGKGIFQDFKKLSDKFSRSQYFGGRLERKIPPNFLVDVTGDGYADFVSFRDDGLQVALNNGNGTFGLPKIVFGNFF